MVSLAEPPTVVVLSFLDRVDASSRIKISGLLSQAASNSDSAFFTSTLLLSGGRKGEIWEPSNKRCSFILPTVTYLFDFSWLFTLICYSTIFYTSLSLLLSLCLGITTEFLVFFAVRVLWNVGNWFFDKTCSAIPLFLLELQTDLHSTYFTMKISCGPVCILLVSPLFDMHPAPCVVILDSISVATFGEEYIWNAQYACK